MPEISVIIPCFNQGEYLEEALESVLAQTFQDFEIIVVNDGSTELGTIEKLNRIAYPKTRVLHTGNLGLPGARNLGIRDAAGKFILPLDADDKIAPTYLEAARAVITGAGGIGIVFCKAALFGDRAGPWDLPEYRFPDVLVSPRIHCCALFRKRDWEAVGGYGEEMIHGWEDFDLWLSFLEIGRGVHCLPETLFYYRQHGKSMCRKITATEREELFWKIYSRHKFLYLSSMEDIFSLRKSLDGAEIMVRYWSSLPPLALSETRLGEIRVLEEVARLKCRQREMEALLARSEMQRRSMEKSGSWRMTAPLRWIRDALGK